MAALTPGNHLYFYQLLSQEMGVGKQTQLARVEEILAEADVLLDDVDCETIEQLLEALDFVKVTVFKKGRVFATVVPRDDLDELLAKAAQPVVDKQAASAGKSWKRARRTKDVRPTKPRHKRPTKVAEVAEAEAAAEEPVAEVVVETNEPLVEDAILAVVDEPMAEEATSETVPEPEMTPEPAAGEAPAQEEAAPAPEPEAAPKEPAADPDSMTAPAEAPAAPVEPEEAPTLAAEEPEPEPLPEATVLEPEAAVLEPEPSINLDITYVPEPATAEEPEPREPEEAEPAPEPEAAPEPAKPAPARRQKAPHKPARAARLPQVLSEEVFLPSDMLLKLYQALPQKMSLTETLDESWAFAQEAGTAEGNRTRVTFPLSRVIEGQPPIEVTIARAPHLPSGKFWKLVAVDDGLEAEQ